MDPEGITYTRPTNAVIKAMMRQAATTSQVVARVVTGPLALPLDVDAIDATNAPQREEYEGHLAADVFFRDGALVLVR